MVNKTDTRTGRTVTADTLAREPMREEALRLARLGRSQHQIAAATGVPRSTIARWLLKTDITMAGTPDERQRLAEAALRAAALCVERSIQALPEATAYEASRAARMNTDIYLDLTEGRKGMAVNIDARQQTAVTVYDSLTADELRRAIDVEESRLRLLTAGDG